MTISAFARAISSIESGGNYAAMGPPTRTGDRAHGRYQVMGSNIGPWSKAALGRELTPQEFLANPQAQDAVFNHRFGQYVDKYGPEGAARAWFAGEGGMNDPGRRDSLGTSVADYGRRFTAALGEPPRPPMPIPQGPTGAPLPLFNPGPQTPAYTGADTGQPPMPQQPSIWDLLRPTQASAPGLPLFTPQDFQLQGR